MAKTAFMAGITGQDGSHLAVLLLSKGYDVHGVVRPSSPLTTCGRSVRRPAVGR